MAALPRSIHTTDLPHQDAPVEQPRLPPCGHPDRWPLLQQLRRTAGWHPDAWVTAIEGGAVAVDAALLTVLAERLDGPSSLRLLRWWWQQPQPDPHWAALIGRVHDPAIASWLRDQLMATDGHEPVAAAPPLLPLLGFQRQSSDGALLARWALAARPAVVRRAALEGLAVGLAAWPQPALRRWLRRLAADLDPVLAGAAVDLLARLPRARGELLALASVALEAGVEQRRQRRLAALPASILVLVVHGRAGGVVPSELQQLANALARRREAPVLLEALTGEPPSLPAAMEGRALTLVPLMLLPGNHVRHDIPAIAARWRLRGSVRRLPFLGAWPAWQRALTAELAAARGASQPHGGQPLLLHHPLEGGLAQRYLDQLERRTGARCVPTAFSTPTAAAPTTAVASTAMAMLPLVLAANRLTDCLTDCLAAQAGPPLLQRPRFQQLLLTELEALP